MELLLIAESGRNLIKKLCSVEPGAVFEPTLLLDSDDCDKVCAEQVIDGKYLFCYFLGSIPNRRKLAKQQSLKLITVASYLTPTDVYFSDRLIKIGDNIHLGNGQCSMLPNKEELLVISQ